MATTATQGRWAMARHLELIDEEIRRLVLREVPERVLVIRMPPRHGKSELVSHWTPTWFEANWPERNVLLGSYEATFAASWGRKARDSFLEVTDMSPGILPGRISADRQAANDWGTTNGGYMSTAGVGGPATGKGFHLGILDDLIKNAEQAQSEVYREKTWEWITSTFWTRREPEGVMVVIGTPWHREDYLARLRSWEEPIREVCLPAAAEADDALSRNPGEALWPARFDEKELDRIRLAQGPYYWNALYQQRPSQHEQAEWPGEYFENVDFDQLPTRTITFRVLSLDPSLGRTDTSDYQAYIMLALGEDGTVYVDADISRRDLVSMVDAGLALCNAFQPHSWAIEVDGFRALDALTVERSKGVIPPIATVKQHQNKVARIRLGVGPYLAYRKLRFKRGSKGAELLVSQLKDFPLGDYDDGPDALEMGLRVLRELAARGGIHQPQQAEMVTT